MKIALVSEGTYPYAMGGVSVWCDQLIRGLPDCRWDMIALTVDGSERSIFSLPDNLDRVYSVPLWGLQSKRCSHPIPRQRTSPDFQRVYEVFLRSLLRPPQMDSDVESIERSRFLLALRGLYDYVSSGGDLAHEIVSNKSIEILIDIWRDVRSDQSGPAPTLADAAEVSWLLEHMLRPLNFAPIKADITHAAMNGLSVLIAFTAKWRYGIPFVMSEHGIYLRERYLAYLDSDTSHSVRVFLLGFFRVLAGAAYLFSDAIAPHSAYNRRWLIRNGADVNRMWTMYNGIDPLNFPAASSEPDSPTITYMGRIDPIKDLHMLIQAFSLVKKQIPTARLRMFGGTHECCLDYEASCRKLIGDLGLTDSAILEGRVHDVVSAYHSGSIVALSSISEGFPYSVIEAMACGRVVVSTNVGGIHEALGDTGIIVPPRDASAFASACLELLGDDERRRHLGLLARDRVLERFTLRKSIEDYRNVYERLSAVSCDSSYSRPSLVSARGRASVGNKEVPQPSFLVPVGKK